MWENCYGNVKCCVCGKKISLRYFERGNCFVCGRAVCLECRQERSCIPPPKDCPRYEADYEINRTKVPVCLKCIKNPEIFFIKDKPEHLPESVEKVFDLCVEAVVLTHKVFPVSSSGQFYNKDYDPNLHTSEKEQEEHFDFSQGVIDLIREKSRSNVNPLQEIEDQLTDAIKLSIGNCKEQSLFCFMYLFYAYRRREIFTMEFGVYKVLLQDHVFLIISPTGVRLPNDSRINSSEFDTNPNYKNVVICDPYKKSVFMATKFTTYMSSKGRLFSTNLVPTDYFFKDLARFPSRYRKIEDLWKNMHSISLDSDED